MVRAAAACPELVPRMDGWGHQDWRSVSSDQGVALHDVPQAVPGIALPRRGWAGAMLRAGLSPEGGDLP